MLSVSGRLCPAEPRGSSAAIWRGQGPGGGDMACSCKLPGVFQAEDELSTFSGRRTPARERFGEGSKACLLQVVKHHVLRKGCLSKGAHYLPSNVQRVSNVQQLVFSHIHGADSLIFWVFSIFPQPWRWLRDAVLPARVGAGRSVAVCRWRELTEETPQHQWDRQPSIMAFQGLSSAALDHKPRDL